ncbi:MAG: hypothetical protein K2Q33_02365 [Gammaproteobacteria bacterium]|nr:hypothetical protein [Gammaproteobacteria bacterium]
MNPNDIEKILYELHARLNNVEQAVTLSKLIGVWFNGEIKNEMVINELQYNNIADIPFIDKLDIWFIPDFLSFLQARLIESVFISMKSIIDYKYVKKIKATTLYKIPIDDTEVIILKDIESRYSAARNKMIAHIDVNALLTGPSTSKSVPWEGVFEDIKKLRVVFKGVGHKYGIREKYLTPNKNVVAGLEEVFKLFSLIHAINNAKVEAQRNVEV